MPGSRTSDEEALQIVALLTALGRFVTGVPEMDRSGFFASATSVSSARVMLIGDRPRDPLIA